jgi:hypothetical protein
LALRRGIFAKMRASDRTTTTKHRPRPAFRPSDLYKIRLLVTAAGEHIPLLVECLTGLPLNRPNHYMLVVRRDRCQVSTMMKEQSVLCIVLAWAHHLGIDLHGLLDGGKGLDQVQLAGLGQRFSKTSLNTLFGQPDQMTFLLVRPLI